LSQRSLPEEIEFLANGKYGKYSLPDPYGGKYQLVVKPIRNPPHP